MSDQSDPSKPRHPVATGENGDYVFHPGVRDSSKLPKRSEEDLMREVYNIRGQTESSRQALIINNLTKITGDKDSNLMESNLQKSGFSVKCKTRLTQEKLEECLKTVADDMADDTDCFVCVVLALGGNGFIKGWNSNVSQTKSLTTEKLCEPFQGNNCKPLVLKPKIFIIMSWDTEPDSRIQIDGDADQSEVFKVPTESDVLVYVCHMPGKFKQGYDGDGSWFIKTLADVMQKNRERCKRRDFLRLLTIVNREMANKYKGTKLKRSECIPTVTSTLTKLIYI
ncbi:caspase-7-like [Pecten maximus]|uniref:caspase-7-like n=1 Tax=Pecten maximus TaxID=6579 RepID=UPI001458B0B1|nr:caspase-7-like [Pecten maximus]